MFKKWSNSTLICAALLAGCSSASTPSNPGSNPSSNPAPSGSPSAGSAPAAVNGCTSYVDMTADSAARTIKWDFSIASDTNRCMKVKVGQSVTFNGNFTAHPLVELGGDSPNPFSGAKALLKDAGLASEHTPITFATAGTFGYKCSIHASMTGAIVVVP